MNRINPSLGSILSHQFPASTEWAWACRYIIFCSAYHTFVPPSVSAFPSCRPSLDDDLYISILTQMYHLCQSRKFESMPSSLVVFGLAESEGDVAVFDHMLDLPPHYRQSSFSLAQTHGEWRQHLLVKLNRIMK